VALYGDSGQRWALTERGRDGLARDETHLRIGPSQVEWTGTQLVFHIDEVGMPIPRRVRGTVRVTPECAPAIPFVLDAAGGHRWFPFSPRARIDVEMRDPDLKWSGAGYLDGNSGDVPLERSFVEWDWSRADLDRGAAVLYDAKRRDGTSLSIAARFAEDGSAAAFEPPPRAALATTGWRVKRATRTSAGSPARVLKTLEDTPFYARSVVSAEWLGQRVTAMHESLSLDRFDTRWVQMLLPFRMPRVRR
jgi:carotenoid 1,2-hydratase